MADLPKVLIIDDEEKILTVARKVLAKENYQVLTSNEVENTLMAIDSQGPHLGGPDRQSDAHHAGNRIA